MNTTPATHGLHVQWCHLLTGLGLIICFVLVVLPSHKRAIGHFCRSADSSGLLKTVALWCPVLLRRNPAAVDVFLSASGDTTVRIWDLRHAGPTLTLPAHAYEVLTAGKPTAVVSLPLFAVGRRVAPQRVQCLH